jgi:hypothetical protein
MGQSKQSHVMYPPFIADRRQFNGSMSAPRDTIEISPTVMFLVVILIVILSVYMIRNITK